jgi:SAM-dependent methyltransferase
MSEVLWHDIECGAYHLDLPLWRQLAARAGTPAPAGPERRRGLPPSATVLDVGAGTGRVALDLAALGHEVVALDRSQALLAALHRRAEARGLSVETVVADARDFALGRTFALILVPMQTIQLLGGGEGRERFLARAREHLAEGGLLAVALADALEAFDSDHDRPPTPDLREIDGVVYASRPIAIRDLGARAAIERVREVVRRDGTRAVSRNVVELDRVEPGDLEAEAAAHGLRALPRARIAPSDEYVGSTVVMLRA